MIWQCAGIGLLYGFIAVFAGLILVTLIHSFKGD